MEYIIYFNICAILIMLTFIISAITRKQTTGRVNGLLFRMMLTILVSAIGDLIYGYCHNLEPSINAVMGEYIGNTIFYLAHNLIIPVFVLYIYACNDIWHFYMEKKWLRVGWWALVIMDTVITLMNGWCLNVFSFTADGTYVRGPWIFVLYAVSIIFGVWGLVEIFYYHRVINKDKSNVTVLVYITVVIGVAVQIVTDRIMMEMFAYSVGFLFYMILVRRDENQIDPMTGAIKYNMGVERVKRNFTNHKPMTMILVKVTNYGNISMNLGQKLYADFLKACVICFKKNTVFEKKTTDVYYLEYGFFSCVSEELDMNKVSEAAENIQNELREEWHIQDFTVLAEPKICVVRCPEDICDFNTLFNMGMNFHHTLPDIKDVIIYSQFKNDTNFIVRTEMDAIIAEAIKKKQLEMYYQPIYSIRENRYVSAEALIRLKSDRYGFISPGLFIPAAEVSGAIHDIGDFVIEAVIRFISGLDMEALGLERIEMNLSASQCLEVELVEKITTLLEDYGVDASRLAIEITESAADVNPTVVDHNIMALHKKGIAFAIDDYGTGYSNIRRVTKLPIFQVKLDKSFVDGINDPKMWVVIKDTIKMLKEMGKEVVVEGVEDEASVRKIMDLNADLIQGCELVQGFYYCKPMPEAEFREFMNNHAK